MRLYLCVFSSELDTVYLNDRLIGFLSAYCVLEIIFRNAVIIPVVPVAA